jgi:hypothetical protein
MTNTTLRNSSPFNAILALLEMLLPNMRDNAYGLIFS